MVHVLYYRMVRQLPADIYQSYFQQLPPFIQKKLVGFRHWQDAERSLSGNILLMKALETVGIPAESIAQLKYTEFQKPYLDAPVSFNITHSGEYIVCAISKTVKVGIDVEEIKEIPLIDFTQFFYEEEWQAFLARKQLTRIDTAFSREMLASIEARSATSASDGYRIGGRQRVT